MSQLGGLRQTEKKMKHWVQEAIMILFILQRLHHHDPKDVCIVEVVTLGDLL